MADVVETTEEETVEASAEEMAQEAPAFNLADLAAVKQIIEVSSRRGAYNAAELSAVGATYDRLMAFLQFHIPPAEEASTPEEAEIETKPDPATDNNDEPEIDRD